MKMNRNQQTESDRSGMYTVSFILLIVACCFAGWCLIALAWLIPMTVMMNRARKEVGKPEERQHIALAVCALLFGGLLSGIFALIATLMFDPSLPYEGSAAGTFRSTTRDIA